MVPEANVDTDMIFHNRHLHVTEPNEMAPLMFGNLPGFEDFPRQTCAGDILVVGHYFGCGSSRQQAVDGFRALGISAILGVSFGSIYKRNAINTGLPVIEAPGILEGGIQEGDRIMVDLRTGTVAGSDGNILYRGKPMGEVQLQIFLAGGLFRMARLTG